MKTETKTKILIVDDSALARRTLRQALDSMGYAVEEASDGAQALERFFLSPPELVILDMVMNGMYGLDVLAKMREMNPAVRILVSTADIQTSTREQVQAAGAQGILNKPVNREQLTQAINSILAGGKHVELTLDQKDALTELINIGYGRAASALSELTGYRITLQVPQVVIHEIDEIGPMLERMLGPRVASVNQVFAGPVSGNALLLLDESSAIVLSRLLSDEPTASPVFDANVRETITEVGNILLNACLGVFGNLLRIHVTFAVPRLHFDRATHLISSLSRYSEEQLSHGLMIHTRFNVKAGNVTGYLVIVLGIASLDRLLLEVANWENRELQ